MHLLWSSEEARGALYHRLKTSVAHSESAGATDTCRRGSHISVRPFTGSRVPNLVLGEPFCVLVNPLSITLLSSFDPVFNSDD